MLASRAERTRGHHVIAGRPAEPQAQSSPPARKGRSEAEWLDWARTAGQFVVVMAASVTTRSLSDENLRANEDARVGIQAGGDGAMPSQAEIQCVCAFTYMNARSRQNLSGTWTDVMNP